MITKEIIMYVGEEVVFLLDYKLFEAIVIKLNNKTAELEVPAQRGHKRHIRNVDYSRIKSKNELFCIVWNPDIGSKGLYRFETHQYKEQQRKWSYWWNPTNYIMERGTVID